MPKSSRNGRRTLPPIGPCNDQQAQAIERIEDWFERSDRQVFKLFGYAGTGKTTLARMVADRLSVEAVYAAYTGKAAHVLRTKGCAGARTIHSLIYLPAEKRREEIDELRRELQAESDPDERRELVRAIRQLEAELDVPGWILNQQSDLLDAGLCILDECSMVNREVARDLLSFGVKTLVLGDPAQLPPPKGTGYFIDGKPDYVLTEVERQAAKSPVLALATGVRSGKSLVAQRVGKSRIYMPLTEDEALNHSQVIVGMNRTRWRQIRLLRALDGLTGDAPMLGDRIICLHNNRDLNVYNGQMFEVLKVLDKRKDYAHLQVRTDDGETRKILTWLHGFRGLRGEEQFKKEAHYHGECAFMTFGQAITCHKSQGSQWRSVLVVDESRVFRNDRTRWMYTAITRAEKRVSIVRTTNQNWEAA